MSLIIKKIDLFFILYKNKFTQSYYTGQQTTYLKKKQIVL